MPIGLLLGHPAIIWQTQDRIKGRPHIVEKGGVGPSQLGDGFIFVQRVRTLLVKLQEHPGQQLKAINAMNDSRRKCSCPDKTA